LDSWQYFDDNSYYVARTHSLTNTNIDFLSDGNVWAVVSFTVDHVEKLGETNPSDIQAGCINDASLANNLVVRKAKD
jgi:hypothetical protein